MLNKTFVVKLVFSVPLMVPKMLGCIRTVPDGGVQSLLMFGYRKWSIFAGLTTKVIT